ALVDDSPELVVADVAGRHHAARVGQAGGDLLEVRRVPRPEPLQDPRLAHGSGHDGSLELPAEKLGRGVDCGRRAQESHLEHQRIDVLAVQPVLRARLASEVRVLVHADRADALHALLEDFAIAHLQTSATQSIWTRTVSSPGSGARNLTPKLVRA